MALKQVPFHAGRRSEGMVKRLWFLNGLEKRGEGGGRHGRQWRGGLVTKRIDRRQPAVMLAGTAGPASPGKSALSRDRAPSAPRWQKASRRDQQ
jgi:hypothetical protein